MGWLVDRLTPYKQEQPRWHDLAVALEQYWDAYHTPAIERLEQMRSVFTAEDADIEWLLQEAGVQFEVGVPILKNNRALAYAWRSYEIHRKDNADTLSQVLSRDFSNLEVRWAPLFAPKNLPYGEGPMLLRSEIELLGHKREDFYRTYRGVVLANLSGVHSVGHDSESFRGVAARKAEALRPAHIVYEGEYFYSVSRVLIELLLWSVRSRSLEQHVTFDLGVRRYDDRHLDGDRLDHPPFISVGDRESKLPVLDAWCMPRWGLDGGDIIEGDYWIAPGIEGDTRSRYGTLGQHATLFNRAPVSLKSQYQSDYYTHSVASYWTLGRYPFDVVRADAEQLDGWLGAPFPGWSQKEQRRVASPAAMWKMPLWGLDGGLLVGAAYWGLAGVEGNAGKRTSSRTENHYLSHSEIAVVPYNGPKGFVSLPLVTNCYNNERVKVALTHGDGGRDTSTLQALAMNQRLPEGPAFDDLPGDLAPLDMHYEEA